MAGFGISSLGGSYIDTLRNLIDKPIGLLVNSRTDMYNNISRNAGGLFDYGFDSWGTPIGFPADPDYTEYYGHPIYLTDPYRDLYPSYIDYVRDMYGATLSVSNINNFDSFRLPEGFANVGSIDINSVRDAIDNPGVAIPLSPNVDQDTILGKVSSWHMGETLAQAIVENDGDKDAIKKSISSSIPKRFGMNSAAYLSVAEGFRFKVNMETGRNDDIFETINQTYVDEHGNEIPIVTNGPVYSKSKGLSYYIDETSPSYDYLLTLSDFQREFYYSNISLNSSLSKNRLRYTSNKGSTYIDRMFVSPSGGSITHITDIEGIEVRYLFDNYRKTIEGSIKDGKLTGSYITYSYAEKSGTNGTPNDNLYYGDVGVGSHFNRYASFGNKEEIKDIIDSTNQMFRAGKLDTLVARFHGNEVDRNDPTATAHSKYGYSHGRNLLKVTPDSPNGYENPYCRVWTYHHQYHRLADAIRPLSEDGRLVKPSELDSTYGWSRFRSPDEGMDGGTGGGRLTKHGVINYNVNGLVNITPVASAEKGQNVSIKNCMFSIENLAWKDVFNTTADSTATSQNNGLSKEQKGPFGGRIMWFPPYDLKFSENVHANWNTTDFIGRGESIYTYTNTSREGSLSFKLLIDHPSIVNHWKMSDKDINGGGVDDIESNEQKLLRFFAGCEKLTTGTKNEENTIEEKEREIPTPDPDTKKYTCFVFFPNNYTGDSDDPEYAIRYLMNGFGAGKYYNSGNVVDYPLEMRKYVDASGKRIGGYEVRTPVSIITTKLDPNRNGFITNVYEESDTRKSNPIQLMSMNGNEVDGTWWLRKWAYRVDNPSNLDLINEKLHEDIHYVDTQSYGLNSGGGKKMIIQTFSNLTNDDLFAFTDLFVALGDATDETILKGSFDESKVKILRDLFNKEKGETVYKITCRGWASNAGHDKKNVQLAVRRGRTIKEWLSRKFQLKGVEIEATDEKNVGKGPKMKNVSDLDQKIYRCAEICVEYKVSDVNNTKDVLTSDDNSSNQTLTNNDVKNIVNNAKEAWNKVVKTVEDETSGKTEREKKGSDAVNSTKNESLNRYDNEGEFFRLLTLKEPMLHHRISDKIKFFDPAFHSISPEGFNARLTFLQQCTRQGPTVGATDINAANYNTANNLAFGRPPVCILRIGDFFYTKIIINSLNIEYDTPWDLNTEGIGVMPMMATVTLQFNFIGGSSLTGPIDRLQNALSFNMYANTEVYDNRAEQVDYDENGEIAKYKAFAPR